MDNSKNFGTMALWCEKEKKKGGAGGFGPGLFVFTKLFNSYIN